MTTSTSAAATKRKYTKKKSVDIAVTRDTSRSEPFLAALSDPKSRRMLQKDVFLKAKDLGMSRKQFYTRLMELKELGLVKKGYVSTETIPLRYMYSKTTLGDTINKLLFIVDELARNAWRFKSLDSVNLAVDEDKYLSRTKGLTSHEHSELHATLFGEAGLKRILEMIDEASHLIAQNQGGENK